jgi:hypothetical protein
MWGAAVYAQSGSRPGMSGRIVPLRTVAVALSVAMWMNPATSLPTDSCDDVQPDAVPPESLPPPPAKKCSHVVRQMRGSRRSIGSPVQRIELVRWMIRFLRHAPDPRRPLLAGAGRIGEPSADILMRVSQKSWLALFAGVALTAVASGAAGYPCRATPPALFLEALPSAAPIAPQWYL